MLALNGGKLHNLCSNKLFLSAFLCLIVLALGTSTAFALDIFVDGQQVELTSRLALRQARAMVPLDCLAEALGMSVELSKDDTAICLVSGYLDVNFPNEIEVVLNERFIQINDTEVDLGVAPYLENGVVMVPLNFFHDVFGLPVEWNNGNLHIKSLAATAASVQSKTSSAGSQDAHSDTAHADGNLPIEKAKEPAASIKPVGPARAPEFSMVFEKEIDTNVEMGAAADTPPVSSAGPKVEESKDAPPENGEKQEKTADNPAHHRENDSASPGKASSAQLPQVIYLERDGSALSQLLEQLSRGLQKEHNDELVTFEGPRLQKIEFAEESGRQCLDFLSSGPVSAEPILYSNPASLALIMEGVLLDAPQDELYVGSGVIYGVKLEQFSNTTIRAVVDLVEPTGYEIRPLDAERGFRVLFNQRMGKAGLSRMGASLHLELEVSGPVRYVVSKLAKPDRMVVDVENTTFIGGTAEVAVADPAVYKMRISQYTPTSTRIVLDLNHPIDIGEVEMASRPGVVELAFIDTEAPVNVGGRLASLGKSFERLLPANVAHAAEKELLTQITSEVPLADALKPIDGDDTLNPSISNANEARVEFEHQDSDRDPKEDETISPVFPAFRRSDIDFSQWPFLQVSWLEADSLAALKGRSVLIDPGHGGMQPGALGTAGVREKTYNLLVALRVGELLQWSGADVSYTRVGDRTVSLRERVDAVQPVNAEVLLSIHANASLTKDATGTETLYHPGIPENRDLAEAVQRHVVSKLGLTDRGTKKRSDLYILRHCPVPSALVEVGFLDHEEEGIFLLTDEAIEKAAMGIVQGLAAYFLGKAGSGTGESMESERPLERESLEEVEPSWEGNLLISRGSDTVE
ncbi:MAG: AMIN domain-containing protein [Firmicutes bacterium]|nr:AMIN domain-containing protein [Bacillota bacterium]